MATKIEWVRNPTQDGQSLRRYRKRWKIERTNAWLGNAASTQPKYHFRTNFIGGQVANPQGIRPAMIKFNKFLDLPQLHGRSFVGHALYDLPPIRNNHHLVAGYIGEHVLMAIGPANHNLVRLF
jgi:hypothetical protein